MGRGEGQRGLGVRECLPQAANCCVIRRERRWRLLRGWKSNAVIVEKNYTGSARPGSMERWSREVRAGKSGAGV